MKKNKEDLEESKKKELEALEYLRMLSAHILEPEAYSRLLLIKAKNPSFFSSIMKYLLYLYQNKKITKKINENELLMIGRKILNKNTEEGRIIIKRKGE